MEKIFNKLQEQMSQGKDSVLVTIVEQAGSTPRGLGTQMLVGTQGILAGTVGGGAIEARAITKAMSLLESKTSEISVYDLSGTNTNDLGMVCGGGVTLLFAYVSAKDKAWQDVVHETLACFGNNSEALFVQNLTDGSASLLDENGELLAGKMVALELDATKFSGSRLENSFVLPLAIKQRVILCGGGHVAQSLVPVLKRVDFRVIVVESREEFARKELFPDAEDVRLVDYNYLAQYIDLKPNDFIIIMTHGHVHDYILQEQILRKKYAYIGVMGSKRKIASVNARLVAAGIDEKSLASVHTPIGVKIGAQTPSEIAISVTAECIAVRAELRRQTISICPSNL
ncbi:MAG: xanthine dehydrogenase accessory protein XdhC [Phascolarctobacterium sp.]|nr:xanthine dehydrogenase accessory protein XdhC [Phascolarctobacterium sp.]